MATKRRAKPKKLSFAAKLFIVIAIALAIIVISGGIPETAQFFKSAKLPLPTIPKAAPPLPKPLPIDCQTISKPGTYLLSRDIDASSLGKDKACFNITTSNVVLDCQGHTLTGPYYVGGSDTSGTSSAVFIRGDKNSNMIKNCNIKNFGKGVFMLAGEEPIGNIGVEIRSPKNNIITGNTFTDNSNSIQITGGAMSCAGEPSGNLIYNNKFYSSQSFYKHAASISLGNCPAFAKFNNSNTGNCWDDYSAGGLIPYGTLAQSKKAIITPDSAADYKPVSCGALPDLIVRNLTFSSSNPKVGDALGATITVCNIGNADASEVSFRVIDLSENNGMAGGFAKIPAGDCQTIGGTPGWPLTIAGVHTVRAIADSDNEIYESDETNNILEKNITVGTLILPDLNANILLFSPSNPRKGDTVNITYQFCNIGSITIQKPVSTDIQIEYPDGSIYQNFIPIDPPFVAGTCTPLSSLYWTAGNPGTYIVRSIVDAANEIIESNENNNMLEKNITVSGPLPDLIVLNTTVFPNAPVVGALVNISSIVCNIGTADATGSPYFSVSIEELTEGITMPPPVISLLRPGECTGTNIVLNNVNMTKTGLHTVRTIVDPNNVILESDETNNQLLYNFNVGFAPPGGRPPGVTL